MNASLRRSGITTGALALLALGGKAAARQWRLAKFYNNVQLALNGAVAHYEGTLYALSVCEPSDDSLHEALRNRPAVDIPNSAELTLDACASVTLEELKLALLTVTLTGKTDVILYVIQRLEVDDSLRAGINMPQQHNDGTATVTVGIMVRDTDLAHAVSTLVFRKP